MRHRDTWVFGYGSLVSPASLATTIGRTVSARQVAVATLDGYGRRWNYGALHVRGVWTHDGTDVDEGVMVALGLVASAEERCNGVAVQVSDAELAQLDHRERDYDRTDVTAAITIDEPVAGIAVAAPSLSEVRVVTYVPRARAVERYQRARDAGRAAIRRTYWDLVDGAFAALGPDHLAQYRSTPSPDIPVVDMVMSLRD